MDIDFWESVFVTVRVERFVWISTLARVGGSNRRGLTIVVIIAIRYAAERYVRHAMPCVCFFFFFFAMQPVDRERGRASTMRSVPNIERKKKQVFLFVTYQK